MNNLPTELLHYLLSYTTEAVHTVCKAWLCALREVMDTLDIYNKHHLSSLHMYSNVEHLIFHSGSYHRQDVKQYLTRRFCFNIKTLSIDPILIDEAVFSRFTALQTLEFRRGKYKSHKYEKGVKKPICLMCSNISSNLTYLSISQLIPDLLMRDACGESVKIIDCSCCDTEYEICDNIYHAIIPRFPKLKHLRITGTYNHCGLIKNSCILVNYRELELELDILELSINCCPESHFNGIGPNYRINIQSTMLIMELDTIWDRYEHPFQLFYPVILFRCNFENYRNVKYALFLADVTYLEPKIRNSITKYKKLCITNVLSSLYEMIGGDWFCRIKPAIVGLSDMGRLDNEYMEDIHIDICNSADDSTILRTCFPEL